MLRGELFSVRKSCYAKRQYYCHKVRKKITLFIHGHFKMKHSLKNLCVLVPWWQAF